MNPSYETMESLAASAAAKNKSSMATLLKVFYVMRDTMTEALVNGDRVLLYELGTFRIATSFLGSLNNQKEVLMRYPYFRVSKKFKRYLLNTPVDNLADFP